MKKIYNRYTLFFSCIICLLFLFCIGTATARFTSKKDTENEVATIAVMANDITSDTQIVFDGQPGSEIIYPIKITNEQNGKVCEVSQNFTIQINLSGYNNLPLKYELYEDEEATKLLEPNANGVYENNNFSFEANKKSSKTLYIKISWPSTENDEQLSTEIDYFTLNVKINQI